MAEMSQEDFFAAVQAMARPDGAIDRSSIERIIARVTPELDGPNGVLAALALGNAYEKRWLLFTEDVADAEAAVAAYERLAEFPPTSLEARSSIAKILGLRASKRPDRALSDRAIVMLTAVVDATRPGTPQHSGRVSNFCKSS